MSATREELRVRILKTVLNYCDPSDHADSLTDDLTAVVEEFLEDFTRAVVKRANERKR